jgi:Flp pilus assembly pilin Flp
MTQPTPFFTFLRDDSGAVTVDWVVLTAAIVGLGFAIMTIVSGGLSTASTNMSTQINTNQQTGSNLGK